MLEFVNSIISKSRFQQPIICFCMLCSLQYRLIWNWCYTCDILYFCVSGRSIIPLWIRRSARWLDYQICNNLNCWRSVDAHFQDEAGRLLLSFLAVKAANISKMDFCNQSEHKLTKMRSWNLLTLRWRSFSGSGGEHVAVVVPSKGCHYLINGSLQPVGT